MRKRFMFLFLSLALFAPSLLSASEILPGDLIPKVQASYQGLKDLKASFEQETTIQDFKTTVKYTGELFLKKKDKMKLVYLQPKKEDLYIVGNQIITYLPDQHQAVSGIFSKEQESQLPLRLLSGESILNREFIIKPASGKNASPYRLLLIPRQKDEDLEKVEIEIDPSTYLIRELRLYQRNQNASSFKFSNILINSGLTDQSFSFIAPEGTDIIRPFLPVK
ncbi:MAG: outer membrane lipoprotein carrier protein LolA [Nitrospirae bacterium]|nr:outer membrane lipoprotein carrier protein LolA [Nitrospirota bacterium]